MKPTTEITTGLWQLNPPPTSPMAHDPFTSVDPYQSMQITYGVGDVVAGNPNRDLLGTLVYSTNKMRVEAQQRQQQWGVATYALFRCVETMASTVETITSRMDMLMAEIEEIRNAKTFVVPLTTLAHEPLQMKLNIPATVEGNGEEFTATFSEANVSASGETEADAIANLKGSLVATYEFLESLPENERGPLPARQWEVLRNVLTR
jgi:hypothetical protein